MNKKSPPSGGLFFVPIPYPNLPKIARFGATIAYTCSKSMKKIEIWSDYKGIFPKKDVSLRRETKR